jgi:hypothetical protein
MSSESPRKSESWKLIALAIFVFAAGFRFLGVGWGLPNDLRLFSYHPDEPVVFAYSRAIEPAAGDFTPGFYNYGTLYLTSLRVLGDAVSTYTGAPDTRNVKSVTDFESRVTYAARCVNALLGGLTALFLFLAARRWMPDLGAALGALSVAVAPGFVVHSRYMTVDVPATFCLAVATYLLALWTCEQQAEEPVASRATKWLALAGVFVGFSAGIKYTGILGLLAVAVVVGLTVGKRGAKDLAIAGVAAAVTFLLATPGIFADSAAFWRDFWYEVQHTSTGHGLIFVDMPSGFVFHLGNLAVGFGIILTVLGAVGLVWAAVSKQPWAIGLLAFTLVYYVLIGRAEVLFLRYTFPLFIGLALGFGWLVNECHQRGGAWRLAVVVAIFGLAGVDRGGLYGSAIFTGYMVAEDPRDQAARYLKEQARGNPNLVAGYVSDPWYYSVPLFPLSGAPRWVGLPQRMEAMQSATEPLATFFIPEQGDPYDWNVNLILEARPDFITFSSFESDDVRRLRGRTGIGDVPQLIATRAEAFEKLLFEQYELDRVFGLNPNKLHDMKYVQPVVYVWKRKAPR